MDVPHKQKEYQFLTKELEMLDNSALKQLNNTTIDTDLNAKNSQTQQKRSNTQDRRNLIKYDQAFVKNDANKLYVQAQKERFQQQRKKNISTSRDEKDQKSVFQSYHTVSRQNPRGFVDFDLQLKRNNLITSNAHDKRFVPYNIFPKNLSSTRDGPSIVFERYLPRDNQSFASKMSDSLFNRDKHLDIYKRKATGILHFGRMQTNRIGIIESTGYTSPEVEEKNKKLIVVRKQHQSVDPNEQYYKQLKGPILKNQYSRANENTQNLPLYMQNIHGKLAVKYQLSQALKENNYQESKYLDPVSTFTNYKSFRVDKNNPPRKDYNNVKKNLTFNQLLAKHGYIYDESMSKKERKREWHVQKQKTNIDSDSDSDDD